MSHTDIRLGLITRLPRRFQPYALLSRWDRPIGTWLLLLPCWWVLALTAAPLSLFVLFAVGAVVMRGAGCTINDILDRDLDAQVERTRARPLPSGTVTLKQAMIWLALQLSVGAAILFIMSPLAITLGLASLILVGIYPLMKRITWWPQLMLGLTFNWGIPLGAAAATNRIDPAIWWLYGAAILWTLIYDTIYAHQDKADDALIGVKSTARLFGTLSRLILFGFAMTSASAFFISGWLAGLGIFYFIGLFVACAHLGWQLINWRPDDQSDCLKTFRSNRDFGLITLAAIICGKL